MRKPIVTRSLCLGSCVIAIVAMLSSSGAALAQDRAPSWTPYEPAAALADPPASGGADAAPSPTDANRRYRSYDMPAITVEGEPVRELKEEELIGSYQQPRWTATRRFPSTRIYVIPEGKVEVEYWYRPTFLRDGTIETRMLQELEIGLPWRFQLDLYLRQDYDTPGGPVEWGGQFEVRWALADWGKIWGNPTLYFEYVTLENRPDKIEAKVLLGGEIAEGWHWGANFVMEWEISGPDLEHEYEFTTGVSKTIIDSVFSAGAEMKFSLIDTKEARQTYDVPFQIGPTFQWKPLEPLTINLETLVGIGTDSPYGQLTLTVGWEF